MIAKEFVLALIIKVGEGLNKSEFFQVKFYSPKEIIFQHVSVKDIVFNSRKSRYEEVKRFRNGDIIQHITSVDIEELVKSGGYIVDKLEGFICHNLDYNLFRSFIRVLTDKRNKFKKEKKPLLQTFTKKCSNSVYGFSRRQDIEESYKSVTQRWMRNECDDSVK